MHFVIKEGNINYSERKSENDLKIQFIYNLIENKFTSAH